MTTQTAAGLLRRVATLHEHLQRQGDLCCGGATLAQCTILTQLDRTGPVTQAELARGLGLDKGWISRSVDALVREGLLVKTPSASDRRSVVIDMTDAGRALCREVNANLDLLSERVLQRIPPEEREGVVHALRLLERALEEELSASRSCC